MISAAICSAGEPCRSVRRLPIAAVLSSLLLLPSCRCGAALRCTFGKRILCTCARRAQEESQAPIRIRAFCAPGHGRDISVLSKSLARRLRFTARCSRHPAEGPRSSSRSVVDQTILRQTISNHTRGWNSLGFPSELSSFNTARRRCDAGYRRSQRPRSWECGFTRLLC